ncbi:CotD family spore coat protein [Siminovitchia sp. FSL H7-0308]|uniref:Spore coat protein D n=1 Tax=Siminovitchia thermophila TaxID=1245522 RepID=A0ABS2R5J2_9BACI|nr:CotD family spore coat protein [Siminovitchia thermophila]MBM7713896.1 spore coat protein D [Siminovitchia thermophila]
MRMYHKPCSCKKPCKCGYPPVKPAMQLPAKTMPAQISPTKQNTEYVGQDVYIPVMHPSHTTQINHTTYKYMHSYPHTKSAVNSISEEHYCVCPPKHHCGWKHKKYW